MVERATPYDRPEGLPELTPDNLLITGDAMHVLDVLSKVPEYADQYVGCPFRGWFDLRFCHGVGVSVLACL